VAARALSAAVDGAVWAESDSCDGSGHVMVVDRNVSCVAGDLRLRRQTPEFPLHDCHLPPIRRGLTLDGVLGPPRRRAMGLGDWLAAVCRLVDMGVEQAGRAVVEGVGGDGRRRGRSLAATASIGSVPRTRMRFRAPACALIVLRENRYCCQYPCYPTTCRGYRE